MVRPSLNDSYLLSVIAYFLSMLTVVLILYFGD